jgi:hypothetical protein
MHLRFLLLLVVSSFVIRNNNNFIIRCPFDSTVTILYFLHYHVVLSTVIMLYFPLSQYFTSLYYHVIFPLCCKNKGKASLSKNIKIIKLVYSSNIHVYFLNLNLTLPICYLLYFLHILRMMPLFFLQIMEDFALPKVNIYTSRCQ